MKYRIKIIEKNNGEKDYVSQVKTDKLFSKWENILYDKYYKKLDGTSTSMTYLYPDQSSAFDAIEAHKKKQEEKYNEKTKQITYRYYE
jgi:hypothetical protein